MNRGMILEAMYEVISESLEWGITEKEYGMFVDGVVAMTEKLIEDTRLEDRVKENATLVDETMTTLIGSI